MTWPKSNASNLIVSSKEMQNVEQKLFANGMPVEAIIQFRVYENKGRFEYYALEVDGQSMNNYMAYSLLDEMCAEAYTMY